MKTNNAQTNLLAAVLLSGLILSCPSTLNAQSTSLPSATHNDEKTSEQAMQKLLQATNERLAHENRALVDDNERLKRDRLNIMDEIRKTKQEKASLIKKIRLLSNDEQEREKSFQEEIGALEKTNQEQSEYGDSLLVRINELENETETMTALYGELAGSDAKCRKLQRMLKEAEMGLGLAVINAPANRFQEARFHYNRGVVAYNSKKWRQAMREFKLALEKNPLDADAHFNLAMIYDVIKNEREKAIEHYLRYVELKPKSPDAATVKNYIMDLSTRNEVWGYPNCQNLDERLWPGRW